MRDVPRPDRPRSDSTRPAGSPSPLRIGELLSRNGLIDHDDLALALAEQDLASNSPPLGRVLLRLGAIDEVTLTMILAEQFGLQVVDLGREADPDPSALGRITREAAHRLQALPLRYEDGHLLVAVAEPPTRDTRREIQKLSGRQPAFVLATPRTLADALDQWFPHPATLVEPPGDDPDPSSDAILDVEPRREEVRTPPSSSRERASNADTIDEPDREPNPGDADRVTSGIRVDDPVVAWLLDHARDLDATSVHLVEERSTVRVRVRVNRKLHETTVLPEAAGTILMRRVLRASGIALHADVVQRGSIPAVPGSRQDWQVRSQPHPEGRTVILKPTRPAQPVA